MLVASGVAIGAAPAGAGAAHPSAAGKGKIITASLIGVSAVPHSSDAWAFGSQGTSSSFSTYVVHRHGSHWSKVPIIVPTGAAITGIAAGSAKSIWAVGYGSTSAGEVPLIDHSTGGRFARQNIHLGTGTFRAVTATSASNAWAVGTTGTGTPLLAHSNGHKWKLVKVAGEKLGFNFTSISASSPSNMWLLGTNPSGTPLTAHWNGHSFKIKTLTVPAETTLASIATASPKDSWIAGFTAVTAGATFHNRTFVDHWNGASWKKVPAPSPGYAAEPNSVTAFGHHAYIVGAWTPKTFPNGVVNTAFALRLVGSHWKTEHVATPGKLSQFAAVSMSAKVAVAVGAWDSTPICTAHSKPFQPLAENLTGSSGHLESTPKLRRSSAHLRIGSAAPAVPAC